MSAGERLHDPVSEDMARVYFCPCCGAKLNWFGTCAMGCSDDDARDTVLEQMRLDAFETDAADDDRALLIDRDTA